MSIGPYIIKVSSQKGGVGKSTISVNLASILQDLGNDVLIIDFDIANPSVGFHLGIENQNMGVSDVIQKGIKLEHAIMPHNPTGLHVLPGNILANIKELNNAQIQKFMSDIKKLKYDFIIFDTAPGYLVPDFTSACDEAIIITTPEISSCTSSMRLIANYRKHNLKSQILINRVKNRNYEIHTREIEEMFKMKAISVINEDEIVPESIAMHMPAVIYKPKSNFSKSMADLGRFFSLDHKMDYQYNKKNGVRQGIWEIIKQLFRFN